MKKVLLVVFLLGLVPTVGAQTSNTGSSGASECKLNLAQAPMIRGIRLGMTVNEVLAIFPGAADKEKFRGRLSQPKYGLIEIAALYPAEYGLKERFKGAGSVDFGFLDGNLSFFTLTYFRPEWESKEQFASKVADTLNLPGIKLWRAAGRGMALVCDGFEINAELLLPSQSTIIVRDLEKDARKIVHEREEAAKEEARRAFKP